MTGALPYPSEFRWADVDPAGRTFDRDTVPKVVAALVGSADGLAAHLLLATVTAGLAERYGSWTVGWRWSSGEDSGGPVTAWCCQTHSVTTPEATAATITAALLEWHDWLTDMAQRFGRFLPLPADDLDGWERAVAHLITAVGESTRYDSSWYDCCETVLGWFLEAAGIEESRRADLIMYAVGGRFTSWTDPPRESVRAAAEDLAIRIAVDRD
ncbi:hypothetical protein [Actinoplanes xinjiangensis]|uniref:Uncharacterized protein n=1 Tax=Actinoplanes xinjiangensis TaxID=512350 RepID=A0A316G1H5_9ACTN|nr:hypothetical protein [Actinoplanes xinjiangensis]PWK48217.1 hypothetical protein BC793_106247 [Actinoplanes xinjiangensis]GIF39029.1 hypothetical protein Axi01nite_33400 [Actinoplanes xinjiangensis]